MGILRPSSRHAARIIRSRGGRAHRAAPAPRKGKALTANKSFKDLTILPEYTVNAASDIIAAFYTPTLATSVQYDRTTFLFSMKGLAQAAAGIAGLIRNDGRMRVICDIQTKEEVIRAAIEGSADPLIKSRPPDYLNDLPPDDPAFHDYAALIAYLVANKRLEIRLALLNEANAIFHPKRGVFTDASGNRVAIDGSVNETLSGWRHNYESLTVFKSWQSADDLARVESREIEFNRLWTNQADNITVIPLPKAYEDYLKLRAPSEPQAQEIIRRLLQPTQPAPDKPAELREEPKPYSNGKPPLTQAQRDEREKYWADLHRDLRDNPANTLATIGSGLWPHQRNFWNKHVDAERDRILIADEVGLGKTIQAGVLLKTRINQGRVKRALILAPKSACRQWQRELRRKFNIHMPLLEYESGKHYFTMPDGARSPVSGDPIAALAAASMAIASYQYVRYHADKFIARAQPYDYLIVDEAHNARFTEVATPSNRRPNGFLRLLRRLRDMADSLLLLTATPMQLHEIELWELLSLLDPAGASPSQYERFYAANRPETPDEWEQARDAYVAIAARPRNIQSREERLIWDDNPISRKANLTSQYIADTFTYMRENAPPRQRMSRHTRELLKEYSRQGLLDARVPDREAQAVAIPMTSTERELYDGIPALVAQCYARPNAMNALGFINTIYRKRISSSTSAFERTLAALLYRRYSAPLSGDLQEVADEDADELSDEETAAALADGLTAAGYTLLQETLAKARVAQGDAAKPPTLLRRLRQLRADGHDKIIVFTQYKDTLDHLLQYLRTTLSGWALELIHGDDSATENETRETRIKRFADTPGAGALLCTDAAAESLNLQFCSAIINYDVPWNPMKLEQRIGRIDRIGQARPVVEVVNLFYEDTAEKDAYDIMEKRLRDITRNVGKYRPILSDAINAAIAKEARGEITREQIEAEIAKRDPAQALDMDEFNSEIAAPPRLPANIAPERLSRPLFRPHLLPNHYSVRAAGLRHFEIQARVGERWLITFDQEAYDLSDESVDWWGPGHPLFPSNPPNNHE